MSFCENTSRGFRFTDTLARMRSRRKMFCPGARRPSELGVYIYICLCMYPPTLAYQGAPGCGTGSVRGPWRLHFRAELRFSSVFHRFCSGLYIYAYRLTRKHGDAHGVVTDRDEQLKQNKVCMLTRLTDMRHHNVEQLTACLAALLPRCLAALLGWLPGLFAFKVAIRAQVH